MEYLDPGHSSGLGWADEDCKLGPCLALARFEPGPSQCCMVLDCSTISQNLKISYKIRVMWLPPAHFDWRNLQNLENHVETFDKFLFHFQGTLLTVPSLLWTNVSLL